MRRPAGPLLGLLLILAPLPARADDDRPLADYFRHETATLAARPLGGIDSAEEWKARRPELQRQLRAMLGLDPWPARTPLDARVTGTVERPDFVVDKLHFQSSPGLYVTGNLYRPREAKGPLPAILYVCGHSKQEQDGVIFGNKTHYQHHAEWYAANGYVCLVVDTLQLGELPGLHHGTYGEGMWWWQSRGYTPAGVEAWNGVRAIDYLLTRPDVDRDRIGVTGRSGGGATSWWLGAIDDRVAAVVPVAGITDLTDHVVDGVVESHCDCMYFVNTERWDFPLVAALVAPKPMLVENTDKDPIFPEDGVRRVYEQLEKVYKWYDAGDRLGLVIGKGGHVDSEEIRHPSFAFFEKWLKDRPDATIDEPDRRIPREQLKVLSPGETPPGNRNDTIHETFLAPAEPRPLPASAEAWDSERDRLKKEVRQQVFGGWPDEADVPPLDVEVIAERERAGVRLRGVEFTSQPGVRLRLWLYTAPKGGPAPTLMRLVLADETNWGQLVDHGVAEFLDADRDDGDVKGLADRQAKVQQGEASAIVAVRGIGPTAWPAKFDVHTRRRFALLGQTLDGMRVWDARRALAALRTIDDLRGADEALAGSGPLAPVALWTAVFEPEVDRVELADPPATVREGPAFLNLDRILTMPEAVALAYPRPVVLFKADPAAWRWAADLAERLGADRWLRIVP